MEEFVPAKEQIFPSGTGIAPEARQAVTSGAAATPAPIVFLFGNFSFTAAGQEFGSTLQAKSFQLFAYLLINSATVPGGPVPVCYAALQKALWQNLPEPAFRNNLKVYLSRLRRVLAVSRAFSLQAGYGEVVLSPLAATSIDLLYVREFLTRAISGVAETEWLSLIPILERGQLLPRLTADWADDFRLNFYHSISQLLIQRARRAFGAEAYPHAIRLVNCIMLLEPLNREAAEIKIRSLYRSGNYSLALSAYTAYKNRYDRMAPTLFPVSFAEVTTSL